MGVRESLRLLLQVLVASFVVGVLLSWLDIDPVRLLTGAWNAVIHAPEAVFGALAGLIPYILTGAVVVVPVVAVSTVLKLMQKKTRRQIPPPPPQQP